MVIRMHLNTEPALKIPSQLVKLENMESELDGIFMKIRIFDIVFINRSEYDLQVQGVQLYIDDMIVYNQHFEEYIPLPKEHKFIPKPTFNINLSKERFNGEIEKV